MLQDDWLTLHEFEISFWNESKHIRNDDPKLYQLGKHAVTQHPSRTKEGPGPKHTNEWLPLLILLKSEYGKLKNWDRSIELRPSFGSDAADSVGKHFDADYRFRSNQPAISQDAAGRIEIVRALSKTDSKILFDEDKMLSKGEHRAQNLRDSNPDQSKIKTEICDALQKKIQLFEKGHYSSDTCLCVWLRREEWPGWTKQLIDDNSFRWEISQLNDGRFKSVVVVGENAGAVWLVGTGL